MRVFLTGGTGFIGGVVAGKLAERGDEVRALVRNPARAARLRQQGAEIVDGELADASALRDGMRDCDAVIHAAAMYAIGVPRSQHAAMYDANVRGTERVMDTARKLEIPRIVYVSTLAAIGDTGGPVVDETFEHRRRYGSYYEETKHLAHLAVQRRIQEGLPVVVVMPGAVYGPGDSSIIAQMLERLTAGKMPVLALADSGFTFVYVEDLADGIVAALDRGKVGECYALGGEIAKSTDLVRIAARLAEVRAPRLTVPTAVVKLIAPLGPLLGRLTGMPPNFQELIASSDGVTYWVSSDKAKRELGYAPRSLEQGLRETLLPGATRQAGATARS